MWSVTLTDAVQILLVIGGLIVLAVVTLTQLGDGSLTHGIHRLGTETDPEKRILIPTNELAAFFGWLGVFLTGALGNVPGQDLMQRVFASNSATTARRACGIAGVMYLSVGSIPLLLALSGDLLFPDSVNSEILPAMAHAFLSPAVATIFLVALLSAILSTIDSAILAPASILAQNVFPTENNEAALRRNRWSVLCVAVLSLGMAYRGEDAYALLEEAYAFTLVGLFVPMMIGLYSRPRTAASGIASILTGVVVWCVHFAFGWETAFGPNVGWEFPVSLFATLMAAVAYFLCEPPWKTSWTTTTDVEQPGSSTAKVGE